jgi:hypothetical protein
MSKTRRCNLFGGGFQHTVSSTLHKAPKFISWDYNVFSNEETFYVDKSIQQGLLDKKSKVKYGWILESKYIVDLESFCYKNLQILKKEFKFIFTHNRFLISLDPELFVFTPANGTWISNPKIYDKTKKISMITSNKTITQAQKFRTAYANKNKNSVDLFGRGFKEIPNKELGLQDYMFSICIENGIYETYYTEKILDCFACGTVPVYLGSPDISDYFNPDGIIVLNKNLDLNLLTENLYYDKIDAIKENLEKVKKDYYTVEDYISERFLK